MSPYKGLAHYTEDDAAFFFGRERERTMIVANLIASRLTLVYGSSGVGKSSLLRAGVARTLRELAREDVAEGRQPQFIPVVFSNWRDDPIHGLRKSVGEAVENLGFQLSEHAGDRLDEFLAAVGNELRSTILIILDQFEEYFLYR